MVPDLGLPTMITGLWIFDVNAPGKNILSSILLIPIIIFNMKISKPVIRGENQVPNVDPTVK